jgi:hydrogenase maturation protease
LGRRIGRFAGDDIVSVDPPQLSDLELEPLPPILVIGVGNPSKGDAALGLQALARLAQLELPNVTLLTDFQLAPEHSLDIIERELVVFVDVTTEGDAPYVMSSVIARHDDSVTTHALSPSAVLDTFLHVTGLPVPRAYLLLIRGYDFAPGAPLSERANANLEAAMPVLAECVKTRTVPA